MPQPADTGIPDGYGSGVPCTVVVTVDAEPRALDEMEAHARIGLERFPRWAGFRSGSLYRSEDGTRMIQLTEWASNADYETCRDDPVWDKLPSTRTFFGHVHSGRAHVDAKVFALVARAGQG